MATRTAPITCVERYIGQPIKEKFEALGIDAVTGPVQNIENQDWTTLFHARVHPLM